METNSVSLTLNMPSLHSSSKRSSSSTSCLTNALKWEKKSLESLHMSQVAHQAEAYPGFCSMKRLGVFLLPPGWDVSPSLGQPPALFRRYPFVHLFGKMHYAQEYNAVPLVQGLEPKRINVCFWENSHLPLPKTNINTYFSLWVRLG